MDELLKASTKEGSVRVSFPEGPVVNMAWRHGIKPRNMVKHVLLFFLATVAQRTKEGDVALIWPDGREKNIRLFRGWSEFLDSIEFVLSKPTRVYKRQYEVILPGLFLQLLQEAANIYGVTLKEAIDQAFDLAFLLDQLVLYHQVTVRFVNADQSTTIMQWYEPKKPFWWLRFWF